MLEATFGQEAELAEEAAADKRSMPKPAPSRALSALRSATIVDETLLSETDRAIVVRFGRVADPHCQLADAQLLEAADELASVMHAFTVELDDVSDFTAMYELHDPFSIMCFYRNRPLLLDYGFGPEPKVTALGNTSAELASVIAVAIRSARGGEDPELREEGVEDYGLGQNWNRVSEKFTSAWAGLLPGTQGLGVTGFTGFGFSGFGTMFKPPAPSTDRAGPSG